MVLGRRSEGRWPAIAESDRSEALAADATPISQNGPPASSGTAAQKAVLPFAPNLRRLVLTFHAMIPFSFKWSKPPAPDAEHARRAARFHGVRELINEEGGVKDGRSIDGRTTLARRQEPNRAGVSSSALEAPPLNRR